MPRKTTTVVPVVRRMPDGRLGVVEKHMTTQKRLTREEQLAQATALMHRRLFDPKATIANLADEFGLCKETVTARLQQARTDGIPEQAREVFIQELLPMSMAVLLEALRGEDKKLAATVALKVVDGLKAMELPDDPTPDGNDGDSFEIFRERITVVRATQPPAVPSGSPAGDRDTIEVLPISASPAAHADAEPAQDPPSAREGSGEAGVETASEVTV